MDESIDKINLGENYFSISKFVKNIGLLLVLNFSIKPLTKLVEIQVHSAIDHTAWGTFMALYSLAFMFSILTDLGINQHFTNEVAKSKSRLTDLFASASGFKLISIIIYPLIMTLVGYLMGYNFNELVLLYFISLTHGLIQLMAFFRAVFQGLQYYKRDAIGSILEKAILLIVLVSLLLTSIDLEAFIIARLASVFLACIILLIMLIQLKVWEKPSFKPNTLKPIIVGGLPFAIMAALYAVHERVDMVMVERLYSKEEAGLYSAAYHIIDFTMMYLWLILTSFFARFSYYESKKAKQKLLNSGVVITSLPLLMVAGFSFFYGQLPFDLFFSDNSVAQLKSITNNFQILSISLIINGLFAILSTYLTSSGFIKKVNRYLILSILLNVVLNFIFIPTYGAQAAAWTTVASNLFVSISYVVIMIRSNEITPPWTKWSKIILVFGIYIGLLYSGSTYLDWYYNLTIATVITLIATRFFRLLTSEYLKEL